jgi:hypothetical protein
MAVNDREFVTGDIQNGTKAVLELDTTSIILDTVFSVMTTVDTQFTMELIIQIQSLIISHQASHDIVPLQCNNSSSF